MSRRILLVLAVLALPLLTLVLYAAALWIAHGGDPDFMDIDACLDGGGVWRPATRACER